MLIAPDIDAIVFECQNCGWLILGHPPGDCEQCGGGAWLSPPTLMVLEPEGRDVRV